MRRDRGGLGLIQWRREGVRKSSCNFLPSRSSSTRMGTILNDKRGELSLTMVPRGVVYLSTFRHTTLCPTS